ncbi:MAG: hypothetical protein JW781_01170 [Deltaproteobacteria bacterium]|nr:hypothetical protein [Candidatus Anaeroferrophillacea bacterium]
MLRGFSGFSRFSGHAIRTTFPPSGIPRVNALFQTFRIPDVLDGVRNRADRKGRPYGGCPGGGRPARGACTAFRARNILRPRGNPGTPAVGYRPDNQGGFRIESAPVFRRYFLENLAGG